MHIVLDADDDPEEDTKEEAEARAGRAALRARLQDELGWLRRDPPPPALVRTTLAGDQYPLP